MPHRDDMEKIKLSGRKKKPQFMKKKVAPHRPSIVSNYSVVSLSDVTEESLEVWRALPEKIRQDPSNFIIKIYQLMIFFRIKVI